MASPADARGLSPSHAGPLGRHTLFLTTPSSPEHPDCFKCLAAPPRERAKPGGPSLASAMRSWSAEDVHEQACGTRGSPGKPAPPST
eukprot:scaffold3944_cov111-Isochrysis_galbana.AAC.9